MPRRTLRRLKDRITRLTKNERDELLAHLTPSASIGLMQLDENVLRHICSFLVGPDRMALLYVLLDERRGLRLCPERLPVITSLFAIEFAAQQLTGAVYRMSEIALYHLPQMSGRFALIACNWTPFKSQKVSPIGLVHWSPTPPHVCIAPNFRQIRRQAASNLSAIRPVVRLSLHLTIIPPYRGACVTIHNRLYRVQLHPIAMEQVDMMRGTRYALKTLYGKAIRSSIATDWLT